MGWIRLRCPVDGLSLSDSDFHSNGTGYLISMYMRTTDVLVSGTPNSVFDYLTGDATDSSAAKSAILRSCLRPLRLLRVLFLV